MFRKVESLVVAALFVLLGVASPVILGQAPTPPATEVLLHAAEAAKVLPSAVFFRGQSAPVQGRNSGGIKFSDGMMVLAALVDNSGYSTAVQQKYQAYFITEVQIEINRHPLAPGAYGVGFVEGQFGVMDIGGHDLFAVGSTRDTELKRPTPLQLMADPAGSGYRLYQGRDYVAIARPVSTK